MIDVYGLLTSMYDSDLVKQLFTLPSEVDEQNETIQYGSA